MAQHFLPSLAGGVWCTQHAWGLEAQLRVLSNALLPVCLIPGGQGYDGASWDVCAT